MMIDLIRDTHSSILSRYHNTHSADIGALEVTVVLIDAVMCSTANSTRRIRWVLAQKKRASNQREKKGGRHNEDLQGLGGAPQPNNHALMLAYLDY